jgi:hypothetical protein
MAMSNPSVVIAALQAAARRYVLPHAVYLFDTSVGNPIAAVLWEDGSWAQEFQWECFSEKRCGELNAMPVSWA